MRNTVSSGKVSVGGPWIPVLKEDQSVYTFTPEELSVLLRSAYADGYRVAKDLYSEPIATCSGALWRSYDIAKETNYGMD